MENVKPWSVPQIKGLRVEDFVNFIVNEVDNGVDHSPENYKEAALNRQWIVNLCKSNNFFNKIEIIFKFSKIENKYLFSY